jgi:hypothetical protein
MKKLVLIFILLCCAFLDKNAAQCTATGTTFDLSGPANNNGLFYQVHDAVVNAAGNLATLSIRSDSSLYFARFDNLGNVVGTPRLLLPQGRSILNQNLKSAYITEAVDSSGVVNGYMIAVWVSPAQNADIWVARLDLNGCPVWEKTIGFLGDQYGDAPKGLQRYGTDNYFVVSSRIYPGNTAGELYLSTFAGDGSNCLAYSIGSMTPSDVTPVNLSAYPTAKWAVCGQMLSNSKIGIAFLDQDFNVVGDEIKEFISGNPSGNALNIKQLGSSLYVSGQVPGPSSKGFLMRIGTQPALNVTWSRLIDFPDNTSVPINTDLPRDIAIKNGNILLGGWSLAENSTLSFQPWLIQFDESGNQTWARRYTHANEQFGQINRVLGSSTGGYWLAGSKWNNLGQAGGTRSYVAKTDDLGQIGSCQCLVNQPVTITAINGAVQPPSMSGSQLEDCIDGNVGSACPASTWTESLCFRPSGCSVQIGFSINNCGLGQIFANAAGVAAPITYTFEVNGLPFASGSNPTAFYPFDLPIPYNVCVTASGANCTATSCIIIPGQQEMVPPVAICQNLNVFLDAGGTATVTGAQINNGSSDNCSQVILGPSQIGYSCATLGLNVAVLTVTDFAGNQSTCTSSINVRDFIPPTVACPSDQIVDGLPDGNGNCVANVSGLSAMASDNCSPPVLAYFLGGASSGSGTGNLSSQNFPAGTSTVTYIATDASGNTKTCAFKVTVLPCPISIDYFEKIYGDSSANIPTRIKAFDDGIYVAGYSVRNGGEYATFSKFDIATGMLIWERMLDLPSRILDFEYDPVSTFNPVEGFVLVGMTMPFTSPGGPLDNNSILLRVDDNGNIVFFKRYQQDGREQFDRVIRHPFAANPQFPFYLIGRKNPAANAPSAFDKVVIYNFNGAGAQNWSREYTYNTFPADDEFHRTLIPQKNGNIIILGNDVPDNDAIIASINGLNGAFVNGARYDLSVDLFEGHLLPDGNLLVCGSYFGMGQGLLAVVDPTNNYIQRAGYALPDITEFREMGVNQLGDIYVIGQNKTAHNGFKNLYKIFKLRYSNVIGGSGPSLVLEWVRYLDDGETDYVNGHFSVTPAHNAIYYADGRLKSPSAFGGYDMLVAALPTATLTPCMDSTLHPLLPLSLPVAPITMTSVPINPPFTTVLNYRNMLYACADFCSASQDSCTVDIGTKPSSAGCYCLDFTAQPFGGVPPYSYSWDVNCDGAGDGTTSTITYCFPGPGAYKVCLSSVDSVGCVATAEVDVFVSADTIDPVLNCPTSLLTFGTDPGICASLQNPAATATDNCPPVTISYVLTDATMGTNVNTLYNKDTTTITATATDAAGNTKTCTYQVQVVDDEDPTIICPPPMSVGVQRCDGGTTLVIPPPTVSDNCPMVSFTTTHVGSLFFPCGTTVIACTATDMAGRTKTCTTPITVNCFCGSIVSADMDCTSDSTKFAFTVVAEDQSGASTCTATLVNNTPTMTMTINSNTYDPFTNQVTFTGVLMATTNPAATTVNMTVTLNCVCPNGTQVTCPLPLSMVTPCCDSVYVGDREICAQNDTARVVLQGCSALANVTQVRWYIGAAPCPPSSWTLYQVTSGCADLLLLPKYMTGDICVYSEVEIGGNAPCTLIKSNVATIHLCAPRGCSLSNFETCYTGTPILPDPITLSLGSPDACTYSVEWLDPAGNVLQTGGTSYTPAILFDYTASPADCYQDYLFYRARVTHPCGQSECVSRIRLYHHDAPKGDLAMVYPFDQPLCPGECAELLYTKGCISPDPATWTWCESSDGLSYSPIAGSGDGNPSWWTNRLYADTWYQVKSKNGACPIDTTNLKIEVRDTIKITSFTADYSPTCDPTGVLLQAFFTPSSTPDCPATVEWYRNGVLIFSSLFAVSPATYLYTPPVGGHVGGNYQCIVKNCCEAEKSAVISLQKPWKAYVVGPCFRCNNEMITLEAVVENMPPGGCTYNWSGFYLDAIGNAVPIPITPSGAAQVIMANSSGHYSVTVTCGGCTQIRTFDVLQCESNALSCGPVSILEVPGAEGIVLSAYPNPTTGMLNLEWSTELEEDAHLTVVDLTGRVLAHALVSRGANKYSIDVASLPSGAYLMSLSAEKMQFRTLRLVKE